MAMQQILLLEDIPKLGEAGDVVTVKAGYARNFLVPQGKAGVATKGKIREIEHHKRVTEEKVNKLRKEQMRVRDRIQAIELSIPMQAGEEGKLFGSVTTAHIAELMAEKGEEIDRRKIELEEPIKALGEYKVGIKLFRDVVASIKVSVVAA